MNPENPVKKNKPTVSSPNSSKDSRAVFNEFVTYLSDRDYDYFITGDFDLIQNKILDFLCVNQDTNSFKEVF